VLANHICCKRITHSDVSAARSKFFKLSDSPANSDFVDKPELRIRDDEGAAKLVRMLTYYRAVSWYLIRSFQSWI